MAGRRELFFSRLFGLVGVGRRLPRVADFFGAMVARYACAWRRYGDAASPPILVEFVITALGERRVGVVAVVPR